MKKNRAQALGYGIYIEWWEGYLVLTEIDTEGTKRIEMSSDQARDLFEFLLLSEATDTGAA